MDADLKPDTGEASIVVGPLLRYAGEDDATLWLETDRPCTVRVVLEGVAEASTPTWGVHGHHFALVALDGLPAGTSAPYRVELDGTVVWPLPGAPASLIRTLDGADGVRLSFGSCWRAAPYDEAGLAAYGADALAALARRMLDDAHLPWPDALLLVGDQVYADEPSDQLVERIHARHDEADPIRGEVHDFEEYTWLYEESWTMPEVRWLLSTVPTCMILDDHDLRDDWNTSWSWRQEMTRQPWWRDRVVGALSSYWIYQHIGNLAPRELAKDSVYAQVVAAADDDLRAKLLDDFAWRADAEPGTARWSFHRDFGRSRLLVVDSRCSRSLEPGHRAMVDRREWDWLVEHAAADVEHLLIGTTLPLLMMPGLHHLEGWNEATAQGAWGRAYAKLAEQVRRSVDLEHWAAFRTSFDAMVDLLHAVASRPGAPASVLVLAGDVHCSYVTEAHSPTLDRSPTRVHQLVMSPFRNPLSSTIRTMNKLFKTEAANRLCRALARRAGVVDPPLGWAVEHGPWFDNGVMTVHLRGRRADVEIDVADHRDGRQHLRRRRDIRLA